MKEKEKELMKDEMKKFVKNSGKAYEIDEKVVIDDAEIQEIES